MVKKNIYKVQVVGFKKDKILVNGRLKSVYHVAMSDFSEEDVARIKAGEMSEIEVFIQELDPVRNKLRIASYKKAQQEILWQKILEYKSKNLSIKGKIISATKGGYGVLLSIGVNAFMPSSLIDEVTEDMDKESLIGQETEVYIVGLNKMHQNVIVSRKAVLIQELDKKNAELLAEPKAGTTIETIVKGISSNGIFVSTGNKYTGFVHNKDITYQYGVEIQKLYPIGTRLKAKIVSVAESENKLHLSINELHKNPYNDIKVGEHTQVKILSISRERDFNEKTGGNSFVIYSVTVEGNLLCKISSENCAFSESEVRKMIEEKTTMKVKINSVSPEEQHIIASNKIKKHEAWQNLENLYKASSDKIFEFPVIRKSEFVVTLGFESIQLFVPINEIAVKETQAVFESIKIGQTLKVKIAQFNIKDKEALLTCKTVDENAIKIVESKIKVGETVKCKLAYFLGQKRSVINIEDVIETTILNSKLNAKTVEEMQKNPNYEFELTILQVNSVNLRIFITNKVKIKKNIKTSNLFSDMFEDLNDIIEELSEDDIKNQSKSDSEEDISEENRSSNEEEKAKELAKEIEDDSDDDILDEIMDQAKKETSEVNEDSKEVKDAKSTKDKKEVAEEPANESKKSEKSEESKESEEVEESPAKAKSKAKKSDKKESDKEA